MDNSLKTKDLQKTAAERENRDGNKTQPKTPDSLRQGANQAAGAASTLRYGPAGDSAPQLRLKRLVWPFIIRLATRPRATRPEPPLFPHKQPSLRIGPQQSGTRSGAAYP